MLKYKLLSQMHTSAGPLITIVAKLYEAKLKCFQEEFNILMNPTGGNSAYAICLETRALLSKSRKRFQRCLLRQINSNVKKYVSHSCYATNVEL